MIASLRFAKVAPDGMVARVLLSFLATAGFFYVNIMPAIVDGLKQGLGFSNQQAGMVASCNVYGAACGALLIVFFLRRRGWRSLAQHLLCGLIAMDLLSLLLREPLLLAGARLLQGFIGGALVGLSYSIFARTRDPDRSFGMLLLVQAGAGGLGVMLLPWLVASSGTGVLFATLIAFSAVTLVMLQFLPEYPVADIAPRNPSVVLRAILNTPMLLALLAVFLFQAANMGLYAYMIGFGRSAGLDTTFIGASLGAANAFGMLGAMLVIYLSTRHGILRPIAAGMLLTLLGTGMLIRAERPLVWIAANLCTAVTWNFVIAYLLGMCARFDRNGEAAVWGGFASKMGLASGPLLASLIVGEDDYLVLLATSVGLLGVALLAALLPALSLDREQAAAGPL